MTRAILAALFVVVMGGCASQEKIDADPLVTARQMQAMGLEGRVVIVFGGSHAAGVSWNITGSSGFAEIILKPNVGSVPMPESDAALENDRYDSDPHGSATKNPQPGVDPGPVR